MPARADLPRADDDRDELTEALAQMARTLTFVQAVTDLTHHYVLDLAAMTSGAPAPVPVPTSPACRHPATSRVAVGDGRMHCVTCGAWVAPEEMTNGE